MREKLVIGAFLTAMLAIFTVGPIWVKHSRYPSYKIYSPQDLKDLTKLLPPVDERGFYRQDELLARIKSLSCQDAFSKVIMHHPGCAKIFNINPFAFCDFGGPICQGAQFDCGQNGKDGHMVCREESWPSPVGTKYLERVERHKAATKR